MSKRIVATVLALILTVGAAGAAFAAAPLGVQPVASTSVPGEMTWANTKGYVLEDGPEVEIVFGAFYPRGAITNVCDRIAVDTAREWSGGKIKITYLGAGELGSNADIIEAVQMGNIDMSMSGVANYAPFVDKFSVFDVGCIPWTYDSVNKALQSPKIHNMLADAAKEMDFRVMGIFLDGFRVVFACHKPVTSFADFKNLKIRCQPNPNMIALWQNLTTAPTPLASGEVYISMQQGLIDAIEQNPATMVSDKTCEQGKFISETNHIANIHVIMFNNDKFNALPKSYQEMLDGVMDSYRDYIATRAEKDNREATEYMVSTGVKVVDFPESELKKMQEAALPQHKLVEKMAGEEIVAIWKDALAEAYAE